MFEIGWSELLVIAVVAIVVVGPKELPRMMRTFGSYMGKVRRMVGDFQRQFDEVVRESEFEEVRKAIHSVRESTPSLDLKAPIDKPLMLPNAAPSPAVAASKAVPAKPKPATRRSAKTKKAAPKLSKKKPATEPKP